MDRYASAPAPAPPGGERPLTSRRDGPAAPLPPGAATPPQPPRDYSAPQLSTTPTPLERDHEPGLSDYASARAPAPAPTPPTPTRDYSAAPAPAPPPTPAPAPPPTPAPPPPTPAPPPPATPAPPPPVTPVPPPPATPAPPPPDAPSRDYDAAPAPAPPPARDYSSAPAPAPAPPPARDYSSAPAPAPTPDYTAAPAPAPPPARDYSSAPAPAPVPQIYQPPPPVPAQPSPTEIPNYAVASPRDQSAAPPPPPQELAPSPPQDEYPGELPSFPEDPTPVHEDYSSAPSEEKQEEDNSAHSPPLASSSPPFSSTPSFCSTPTYSASSDSFPTILSSRREFPSPGDEEDTEQRAVGFGDHEWAIDVRFCYPSIRALSSDYSSGQKKLSREHEKRMETAHGKKNSSLEKTTKWGETREADLLKAYKNEIDKIEKEGQSALKQQLSAQRHEQSHMESSLAGFKKSQEKVLNEGIKAWCSQRKADGDQKIAQAKVEMKGNKAGLKKKKAEEQNATKVEQRNYTLLKQTALKHELANSGAEKKSSLLQEQNFARLQTLTKALDAKHEAEIRNFDSYVAIRVQNRLILEECRLLCVELFCPVIESLQEEKKKVDFETMDADQSSDVAQFKKRQTADRKAMFADVAQRKKALSAQHKQKLKEMKKSPKNEKARQKEMNDQELVRVEEEAVREFEEKEKRLDSEMQRKHQEKRSTLESNWRTQESSLLGSLTELRRPRPVATVRMEKNVRDMAVFIDEQREEKLQILGSTHMEREEILRKKMEERITMYRAQCGEWRGVLTGILKEVSETPWCEERPDLKQQYEELGNKEEQMAAEGEQLIATEKQMMENENEEVVQHFKVSLETCLAKIFDVQIPSSAPLPRSKFK